MTYLPFGPISQLTYGNSRTQTRAYDQNYWIDDIDGSAGDSLQLDAELDDAGNIIEFVGNGGAGNTYIYDDLYRLTGVDSLTPAALFDFTYDDTGNRLSKSVNGGSAVSYTIDSDSHRLDSVGAAGRSYDANGNTTAMTGHTLAYDDRNRLSDIDLGADDLAFEYNARGERVEKLFTPNGAAVQTTTYVYDEIGRLLVEKHVITGGASTLTEIVWLDDLPVGLLRNNVLYYIEPDHLGTPRQVIHPGDNEAIWRWSLLGDPFGEVAADTDPDSDSAHFTFNLRFPGQVLDAESGLHYNYFRDYEPGIGRYVQSDPIGLYAGLSTYSYVSSRPTKWSDRFGLEVLMCRDPAFGGDIPGAEHHWVLTDSKEVGLCADDSTPNPLDAAPCDHSGRHEDEGAVCEVIPDVDEPCVDTLLDPGNPFGWWVPFWNDCKDYAEFIIGSCPAPEPPKPEPTPACDALCSNLSL